MTPEERLACAREGVARADAAGAFEADGCNTGQHTLRGDCWKAAGAQRVAQEHESSPVWGLYVAYKKRALDAEARLRAVEGSVKAAVATERQWWLDNLDENIGAVLDAEARRGR